MKASEIFKNYPEEYCYLTKSMNGMVILWKQPPIYINDNIGWYDRSNAEFHFLYFINVDEFEELDWKDCIIERVKDSFEVGGDLILSTKTNDNDLTKLCKQFVKDFELDYVDDNKYVDNPPMMLMDYYVKFKQLLSK